LAKVTSEAGAGFSWWGESPP